jgi:hypothetical protein
MIFVNSADYLKDFQNLTEDVTNEDFLENKSDHVKISNTMMQIVHGKNLI